MAYEKFQAFLREIVEGDDWEYGDGTLMTQDAGAVLALLQNQTDLQRITNLRLRDGEPCGHPGCLSYVSHPCEGCGRVAGQGETISDGFGSIWSAYCPRCGEKTMQIVRPGRAECSECAGHEGVE